MTKNLSKIFATTLLASLALLGDSSGQSADGTAFAEIAGTLAAEAKEKKWRAVVGDDKQWLFLRKELDHLAHGEFWKKDWSEIKKNLDDPRKVIIEYQEGLKKIGVDLILVPVPAKAAIYPDKLSSKAKTVWPMAPFYEDLTKAGVSVIDIEPSLRAKAATEKVYCEQDTHWTPSTSQLVADLVYEKLKDLDWVKSQKKLAMLGSAKPKKLKIVGDLASEKHTKRPPEVVTVVGTGVKSGGILPVAPDSGSPVILLGDSHTLVFSEGASGGMHCKSAGLPDHLQTKLGFAVDLVASKASGADGARRNLLLKPKSIPGYWDNKKVIIWCFSVREFTQSKWRSFPVRKN